MTESTSSPEIITADIVIVGYGPVGAALAILLAQAGHRVVVLERWLAPFPLPRAVHFDHEAGRILQSCGIGSDLRDISEPAEVYEWRNAAGTTLLRFGRIGTGTSGWPESSMFNQPALEALLDRRAADLSGIDVRRGVEVVDVEQSGSGVVVSGTMAGGRSVEVRSPYAIGCDGANSTIRRLLELPVTDLGFLYDWLIVDVVLDQPRVFDPLNLQVCDPARPTTAVSGGPGRRRWEFMRLPDETIADLDSEATAWTLLAPWDVTPDNARLERHAVYTFNARYAECWRTGRVLLAGDAAHQMPPFAGQGMCSGLRDAANLAWKLDLVLTGRAADSLLDTYPVERIPDAKGAIEFSMALGRVICVPDFAEAAVRDAAMSSAVGNELAPAPDLAPILVGLMHHSTPHAGGCSPQPMVGHNGIRVLFDDAVGAGWRLTTCDVTQLDGELVAWFESIGGRTISLSGLDAITDVDGAYAEWFSTHNTSWTLQRPDFRLYGTADNAADAEGLLRHLRDQLPSPTNQGE